MDLTKKMCVACEGTEKPFDRKESNEYLKKVKIWELSKDIKSISKDFQFKNFKEAINFINKVAKLAESEGHHPDILLHNYRKVKINLTTHAIKGLSENDFIIATKIDSIKD